MSPRHPITLRFWSWTSALLAASVVIADATPESGSNAPAGKVLLLDSLGRLVEVPTNKVPASLLPSAKEGLQNQIPTPTKGASTPEAVLQRTKESREKQPDFELLPSVQPLMMPYLASQAEFGNTALKRGPLFIEAPLEPYVQGAKYWLSDQGLRYSLQQTLTFVGMSDVMQGNNTLGYYTFDFQAKWAIYNARDPDSAGWLSTQIEAKSGLGDNGMTQDARRNLGTVTDPTGIWSSVNGLRVPELTWQQSLRNGEVVVVAGMISQGNYLDANAYASSGRGQFINSALIDTLVMPLPNYCFGLNLAWQPRDDFYVMFGPSAGNSVAGQAPWNEFTWETWSLLWEFGYAPTNVCGWGPGIYRVQPFVAGNGGVTQGGLCFNLQQQLGEKSPFGWFGRFGFGGSQVSADASAEVGTGFVMKGPLKHLLLDRTSNDLLGVGFVWSQPAATSKTVYHENEYVLEAVYTLQFSPMIKIQPDLQVVWNPAFNPNPAPSLVAQIQLVFQW